MYFAPPIWDSVGATLAWATLGDHNITNMESQKAPKWDPKRPETDPKNRPNNPKLLPKFEFGVEPAMQLTAQGIKQ